MKLPRRQFLHLAAGAAALPTVSRIAGAQTYPTRSVRIVVGFGAGIMPDIIARLIAQSLSERLGQQFVVDDRPGAGSTIATEFVVRAPADGYTLLAVTSTNAINATVYDRLNYDFIRDIAPVAGTIRLPSVIVVTPSFQARTVPDFIAYAKANPGKVAMASAGTGSASHVIGELFKAMTGIDIIHVPYRNSYMPDLLGGQVHVAFSPLGQSIEYIRDGKLRALAVTGATRSVALPDVPAISEFVQGYEAYVWDGIGAPKDTSAVIIDTLNKEINAILADPKTKARLLALDVEPMSMTPAEFAKFIADETEKWAKVVKFAEIKAQ